MQINIQVEAVEIDPGKRNKAFKLKDNPRMIAFEGILSSEDLEEIKGWWQRNHEQMLSIIDYLNGK